MITLTNCTLMTLDEQDAFYPQGRLVVDGKRIVALGLQENVPVQGECVDMRGALVMPGLVNAHTHSHSSIYRGLADDLALMDWLNKAIWPMERRMSVQHLSAAVGLSCLEYIQSGITTIADHIYHPDVVARETARSGLRSFLAASIFSGAGPAPGTQNTFADAKRFVDEWQGSGEQTRIYPCIGPHAPYSVDETLFRQVVDYAEKKDLPIHIHLSETTDENRQITKKTGLSPTAWLHSLGVFSRPVQAAHSIHLSADDMALYAKYHVAAIYNPISNLKLVSGIMPVRALLNNGIVVAIGTDGAQSNNSMDLLRDVRTGALIQKQWNDDATFLPARQAVRMATTEGARALRFENEIGSLETGKRADLIALDPTSVRLTPMHRNNLDNLYSLVCYSAISADVRDVMVDGQWLMQERRVLTMDEAQVRLNAQKASAHLLQ